MVNGQSDALVARLTAIVVLDDDAARRCGDDGLRSGVDAGRLTCRYRCAAIHAAEYR